MTGPLPQLLADTAGLRWTEQLHGLARTRLDELARAHGGLDDLLRAATVRPDVASQVAAAFTVGETWFQRIGAQLEALPELLAGRRHVRAWSAGCSTGEEAYALAAAFTRQTVEVLGTDLNSESVRRAREGRYGAWSFRGVPPEQVRRSFERRGDLFEVRADLRRRVRFAVHNLTTPAPLRDLDVIACRNVTIYFTPAAAGQVYTHLARALAPGGVLLLAPSDPRPPAHLGLVVERSGGTQVLRRPAFAAAPGPAVSGAPGAGMKGAGPSGVGVSGAGVSGVAPVTPGAAVPDAPRDPELPEARRAAYEAPHDPQAQLALAWALRRAGQDGRAERQARHTLTLLDAHGDSWLAARVRAGCLRLLDGAGEG
ncbi:CheR family methyltransferase [Deinococcus indicus]|uniref:CheR family methyltransferase n=1 Tax=Deinococcus indicus TaxID=223556 RepID=UPI001553D3A5|nr:CheR family methyltransferase [Deinococcus indicus]